MTRTAGKLNEGFAKLKVCEEICLHEQLDASPVFITLGRISACLKKYKQAEHYSSKACHGFVRQWIERLDPSQPGRSEDRDVEEQQISEENISLLRNLAVAFYTNASHKEKLEQYQEALESAQEAKVYQSKLPMNNYRDQSFKQTIDIKIDNLRSKLNGKKTMLDNNSLIKQRADQNMAKLQSSMGRPESGKVYSTYQQNPNRPMTAASKVTNGKNLPSVRSGKISEAKYQRATNTRLKSKKDIIIKKKIGSLSQIVKDPSCKKNFDSVGIRVTPLYLHNEYFHGNYSNGVQMFKATSNNEKFYPYKALNPVPNDKNYEQKTKPTMISAGHVSYKRKAEKPEESEVADLTEDIEREIANSFDSNPAEIINLPSHQEDATFVPTRPKSAIDLKRKSQHSHDYQSESKPKGQNEWVPKKDVEDQPNDAIRKKSRSNTNQSNKPQIKKEGPDDDDEF